MQVYKFGGASVKNAEAVRNLARIVGQAPGHLLVVVSAMDKTTVALERLAHSYFHQEGVHWEALEKVERFHLDLARALFAEPSHPVFGQLGQHFDYLRNWLSREPSLDYDFEYDQVVSVGELLSTRIVSAYLNAAGVECKWLDARRMLKTDDSYREGRVDWKLSEKLVRRTVDFGKQRVYLTQGFLGGTPANLTTTLGKEGSDFTAAICGYFLDAESVTVWKDVDGIYNADPKIFARATKLDHITYREAIELAFYGARVIHPRTIQPLQNKRIPLLVRSFQDLAAPGTRVHAATEQLDREYSAVPIFIFKPGQTLISISPTDFSFIAEDNLSRIFAAFARHRVKTNLMQQSAISFTVCVNHDEQKIPDLLDDLSADFQIRYNHPVELITIRHYDKNSIREITMGRELLMEQRNRSTVNYVVR